MASKGRYLSQGEIDHIEHCIWNNIPYTIEQESEFNETRLRKILLKGEEYVQLENSNYEHFVLTSYGRLINSKTGTVNKIRFSRTSLIIYLSGTKIDHEKIFEQQGWEWDFEVVKNRYEKLKWKHFDAEYGNIQTRIRIRKKK